MGARRIQPLSLALFVLDLILVPGGLWIASELRTALPFGKGGALPEAVVVVPWFIYLIAIVCWGLGLVASGVYNPQQSLRWFNEAWRVVLGAVVATILMAGVLYMTYRELSRLQFSYFFILTVGLLLSYRAGLRLYYRSTGKARPGGRSRILIIGAGELGGRVAKLLLDQSRWGFEPIGFVDDDLSRQNDRVLGLPVLGTLDDLSELAETKRLNEVWVALPVRAHDRLAEVLAVLERLPVRVKIVPDYFSLALVKARAEIIGDLPIIGLRDPLIEGVPRLIKRVFDLVITVILLIPCLGLMVLIALLIRLDTRGPALLRQKRAGENGRPFDMLKFRTMILNAENLANQVVTKDERGQLLHKRKDDPRVTRVGRFLRRYSLDELPQLFNVLKGDMSLVGPRPEIPWLVDKYEPWQRKRFAVPQGITGWWQINGRSDKPMHLHTVDDLYYVYNYSLLLDLWILLRTPIAVLRGKGAF